MIDLAESHTFAEIGQRIREAAKVTQAQAANEQQTDDVKVGSTLTGLRERPFTRWQRVLVLQAPAVQGRPVPHAFNHV